MSPTPRPRPMNRLRLALSLVALGALLGCAAHATYPERVEEEWSVRDPNINPVPEVMRVALQRVTSRFPVNGPYVVNLPQGMQKRWAEDLLRRLKDPNANLVSAQTADLPAFHVAKVWVRPGSRAWVDILRPVFGVGGPQSEGPLYQRITVQLRQSPLEPWQVDSVRVWPLGIDQPPALFGWPALDSTSPAEPMTPPLHPHPHPHPLPRTRPRPSPPRRRPAAHTKLPPHTRRARNGRGPRERWSAIGPPRNRPTGGDAGPPGAQRRGAGRARAGPFLGAGAL